MAGRFGGAGGEFAVTAPLYKTAGRAAVAPPEATAITQPVPAMDLVEVELARVVIHEKDVHQLIHLRERRGRRSFPIVIAYNEVDEIKRKLSGMQTPRPMTHDLIGRILGTVGYRLHRVIISDLREATFYATLVLMPRDAGSQSQGTELTVDCRPSDAIALAVQTGAPILVAREVFDSQATE